LSAAAAVEIFWIGSFRVPVIQISLSAVELMPR
jgi:hypothetical protein